MKFHVGHIAYPDNSVNRFACLNTIQGVYAELWERGVHPRECDRVCRELSSSVFTNTTSTTVWADREVIEAHRIMSDIEIVFFLSGGGALKVAYEDGGVEPSRACMDRDRAAHVRAVHVLHRGAERRHNRTAEQAGQIHRTNELTPSNTIY
jgi:hypothetical protein